MLFFLHLSDVYLNSYREPTVACGLVLTKLLVICVAVWPSFWTSLPPTRHRRYCYSQIQLGSYKEKWPTRTPASRSTTCRVC